MSALYRRKPEIVYRPEGQDGALLFDPDTAQVQVVNLTGAFIWERLDGERTLGAICAELPEAFDEVPADPERRLAEAEAYVRMLVRLGFAGEVQP